MGSPDKRVDYLDQNVLEAAQERCREIYRRFNHIMVAFSGGKDSTVALDIYKKVAHEEGYRAKIKVFYRDEEFVPTEIIKHVNKIVLSGEYDFRYYCLQAERPRNILGELKWYVTWQKDRDHFRKMPGYAIRDEKNVYRGGADKKMVEGLSGQCCIITGLRASESPLRMNAVLSSINALYSRGGVKNLTLAKPLYDWSEKDVLKYIHDNNLAYCQIYNQQLWAGVPLRTHTYLEPRTVASIPKLKEMDPEHWQQLINFFPDMDPHATYISKIVRNADQDRYPVSWQGIYRYINERLENKNKILAKKVVAAAYAARKKRLAKGLSRGNYGGYPIYHIWKYIVGGKYNKQLLPVEAATAQDHQYEDALNKR
jgi:predicted phosphoadenosine phosphosulfate sulfurtransferase